MKVSTSLVERIVGVIVVDVLPHSTITPIAKLCGSQTQGATLRLFMLGRRGAPLHHVSFDKMPDVHRAEAAEVSDSCKLRDSLLRKKAASAGSLRCTEVESQKNCTY
jgi:hypothetical protein